MSKLNRTAETIGLDVNVMPTTSPFQLHTSFLCLSLPHFYTFHQLRRNTAIKRLY